ncbi:helix-turn-helix domain-containing protein [Streptomyces sp. L500]
MDTKPFAQYLKALRLNAGKPTYRELETHTGYSKTVIGDAFQGRRLPTWPVTEALVRALQADREEARQRWAAAGGGSTSATPIPGWLIESRSRVPKLRTGKGLAKAAELATTQPYAAIDDGWEVTRLSAVQLAGSLYQDLPGRWTSNIVATFRRAEDDGHLPGGAGAVAAHLNVVHVGLRIPPYAAPSTEVALQYVVLAYRLAYLVNVTLHGEPIELPAEALANDEASVPPEAPVSYAAGGRAD